MAPILGIEMDAAGNLSRRVKIKPQIGTNGQTIDLLLRQNNDVWVIPSEPNSIFTHLINKLPENQRKNTRAIIDEGCQFRGIANHQVAKMIIDNLPDDRIKAVLFFDQNSGKLCYVRNENPDRINFLKGTKSVFEETGLEPEELFTYYDQDHITGTDIPQMDDAIGIATMNENSRLPNELQQVRRLRKMDFFQRIITAVQKGSLDKISHAMNDPDIRAVKEGKVQSTEFLKKLILFAHLNEAHKEQADNLEFCIQQMESIIQQYLRDGIYTKKLDRTKVYSNAQDLFRKNIGINLYREHSKKRVDISNEEYLQVVREGLLSIALRAITAPEVEKLRAVLKSLEASSLKGIQEKLSVSPDFGKKELKTIKINREAVVLQRQVNVQTNVNVNINIQQNVNLQINPAGELRQETPWNKDIFKGVSGESEVKFLTLSKEISNEIKQPFEGIIDPRIKVTDNFFRSLLGPQKDLVNGRRKPIMQVGLIQNEKGEWSTVLGSVKDMWKFSEIINTTDALPKGSKAWLIRPQGNLAWPGPSKYDKTEMLKNKEVVRLLVQTLLLSSNIKELCTPFWNDAMRDWLRDLSDTQRKELRTFVEKVVFLDQPPKNFNSTPIGQLIAK